MIIKVKLSRSENINYYHKNLIEIDIEEYLKGVVPSEIGNAPLEAGKAQAIAARTFALNKYKRQGYITDKSSID
jgi:SpoIID/LytB domain protein